MVSNIVLSAAAWASSLRSTVTARLHGESGQDLIEYAVLAGAIGIALFVALVLVPLPAAFASFGGTIRDCVDLDPVTTCP